MIDELIDELFALLFEAAPAARLDARMALKPRSGAQSYFIDAPRPRLSRDDMERPDRDGLAAELRRLLDDLPEPARSEVVARIVAIAGALGVPAGEAAEPSSLIYALH